MKTIVYNSMCFMNNAFAMNKEKCVPLYTYFASQKSNNISSCLVLRTQKLRVNVNGPHSQISLKTHSKLNINVVGTLVCTSAQTPLSFLLVSRLEDDDARCPNRYHAIYSDFWHILQTSAGPAKKMRSTRFIPSSSLSTKTTSVKREAASRRQR